MIRTVRSWLIRVCIAYLQKNGIPTPRQMAGGSVLSDRSIAARLTNLHSVEKSAWPLLLQTGHILVSPMPQKVTEASLDLCLGSTVIDPGDITSLLEVSGKPLPLIRERELTGPVLIKPHGFILAKTQQQIGIPDDLLAQMFTCSRVAQLGLWCTGSNSQLMDPGYGGHVVMEIHNNSERPIELRPGMNLLKAVFLLMDRPAESPCYPKGSRIQSDNVLKHSP